MEQKKRPWWKKKRSAAALATWLVLAYPLSLPPLVWVGRHRWCPNEVCEALDWAYVPLERVCYPESAFGFGWYRRVVEYVGDL